MTMGNYITTTTIENQTGSALGQTILEEMIDFAEAELTAELAGEGYSDDTSSNLLKAAAVFFTMKYVYNRYRLDGTKPASLNIGGLSMGDNIDQAILGTEEKAKNMVKVYVKQQQGDPFGQSSVDVAETIARADARMGDFDLDQSVEEEYPDLGNDVP